MKPKLYTFTWFLPAVFQLFVIRYRFRCAVRCTYTAETHRPSAEKTWHGSTLPEQRRTEGKAESSAVCSKRSMTKTEPPFKKRILG